MIYKLGDLIAINPKISLSKGKKARKIAMEDITPFTRDIGSYSFTEYKGGTKFQNGDTLLVRITPCLENGKTAFVNILKDDEVAFGSTEYFVLRAKEKVMDPYYLYYLVTTSAFRKVAIKSMTGTSGRQRAQKEAIENFNLDLPSLIEQKRISYKLKILDDKIALNKQINANFTDQIKTISNSLFSYFEAFNGKMPGDWHYEKLTDIANIDTGYSYKGNELKPSSTAMATIKNFNRKGGFNIEGFKEIRPNKDIKSEKYAKRFDILVAHTDLTQNADIIGNAEPILDISNYTNVIYSMDLVKVTTKDNRISQFLLSLILQGEALKAHCLGYINGTTVLHLSKKALKQFEIPLPNDLHDLDNIDKFARKAYLIMGINLVENRYLQSIKNELLEKYF